MNDLDRYYNSAIASGAQQQSMNAYDAMRHFGANTITTSITITDHPTVPSDSYVTIDDERRHLREIKSKLLLLEDV